MLALALLVAACGDNAETGPGEGDPSTTATTGAGAPGPDEAAEAAATEYLAEARAADGYLPAQVVLDLFAALYGPVPGADPSRLPAVRSHDGTLAARNTLRVWDELTPEQQAAVAGYLDLPPGPQAQSGAPNGALAAYRPSVLAQSGTSELEASVTALALSSAEQIEANMGGRPLNLPIRVIVQDDLGTVTRPDGTVVNVAGDTLPVDIDGVSTCRMRFRTDEVAGDSTLPSTVAHEVFHCFQFDAGDASAWQDWIVEGQAEWVGARIGGTNRTTDGFFSDWIEGHTRTVFAHDYPAAGLYWALEQAGIDPWGVLPAMWGVGNVEALAATGLAPGEAMRWLATTDVHANESPVLDLAPFWQLGSPDVPPARLRNLQSASPDNPFERDTSLQAYSRGSWILDLEGDIAEILVDAPFGALQFEGKDHQFFEGAFAGTFCLREEGCTCDPAEPPLPEGSDTLALAVAAETGGAVSVKVEMTEFGGEGFADGRWAGEITATPIFVTSSGGQGEGNPLISAFELTAEEGRVTGGAYMVAMELSTQLFAGGGAQGFGTISGTISGCAFSPRLIPTTFTFEGTVEIAGQEQAVTFVIPLGGEGTGTIQVAGQELPLTIDFPAEGGNIGNPYRMWQFATRGREAVAGTLDNAPFLAFMRVVDLTVNDVIMEFSATRIG